jgi:indolepyruvate ferredoxin oxidoreductase beta subunit
MSKATNILIVGVGGQGNRTLMKIIASAALGDATEVRVLSSTSLGRLGGPIACHIRLGPSASTSIPAGEADILVALEMNEALRAMPMMRREAVAFIYTHRRIPITTGLQGRHYPSIQEIEEAGANKAIKCIFVPAVPSSFGGTVQEKHPTKFANTVMLGAFCSYTQMLPRPAVEQSLYEHLPAHTALENLHTFATGWQYGEAKLRVEILCKPRQDLGGLPTF